MENLDYQYKNCYYLNPSFNLDNSNIPLDDFLNENFIKTRKISTLDDSLNECKEQAKLKKKDFFLVSNLENDETDNTLKYNCYIPKLDSNCDFSNISNFVNPFNQILKKLLGSSSEVRKSVEINTGFFEISSNNYQENILSNPLNKHKFDNAKCFKSKNNNSDEFSNFGKIDNNDEKNSTFALYKTDFILDENTNNIVNSGKYSNMYNNYNTHKDNYENNFVKQDFKNLINSVELKFKDYLCDKDRNTLDNVKERSFDQSISNLGNYYNTMFSNLDELSNDISNVYIITKYDLYRLNNLEEKIKNEKLVLRNLLGFDGASNGKLFDTLYLKNIKLSETIILSLIIIFLIYFYAKKK